jgi:hypothetical protein
VQAAADVVVVALGERHQLGAAVRPTALCGQALPRGVRPRAAGTLTRRIAAGRSRIRLSGRIGRRALRPGNYRLRLTAVDAVRNRSVPSVLRFTVVR